MSQQNLVFDDIFKQFKNELKSLWIKSDICGALNETTIYTLLNKYMDIITQSGEKNFAIAGRFWRDAQLLFKSKK